MISHTNEFCLMDRIQARAKELIGQGLIAGDGYQEVWIRDLATIMHTACQGCPHAQIERALQTFFDFQRPDGEILDRTLEEKFLPYVSFHYTRPDYPGLIGHKNTVSADQESSLILAVRYYVESTGNWDYLERIIDGRSILERLEDALNWLYRERVHPHYGLVWNATTIDWGDVQPEDLRGYEMTEASHPAITPYPSALLCLALESMAFLQTKAGGRGERWKEQAAELRTNIRRHLWQAERVQFKPHIFLEKGSPFPEFDESGIFFHGGTGVAMSAGILTRDEALACYERMKRNVGEAGARSIGITHWPLYDVADAVNPNYRVPFAYQNGGDWPWWGGRSVQGLVECGLMTEAIEAITPMLEMIEKHGGFYEWHHPDGTPHGSASFRGAAGTLSRAIDLIRSPVL